MSGGSMGQSLVRTTALVMALAAPLTLPYGCWRGSKPSGQVVAPASSAAAPKEEAGAAVAGATAPEPAADASSTAPAPVSTAAPEEAQAAPAREAEPAPAPMAPPQAEAKRPAEAPMAPPGEPSGAPPQAEAKAVDAGAARARPRNGAAAGTESAAGQVVVARLPESQAFDHDGPYWTRAREELVYRIEFLGITMGYARFVFEGKALLGGRPVYHLSVRAWTSSVLAILYPVNETIDYYMDIKTLAPLRQEYTTGGRKKDDVATYDQGTGKIVYRYKESGEIRKQVDAVPNIYDPVTLAYFIRSREPGAEQKGQNVYAGRKVWEISASPLGTEKIVTDRGEFETVVIRPVIKRDGKVEDKGDLRMWMTRDERRIPVRVYAKFRKIRMWTLVGELMPERKGG